MIKIPDEQKQPGMTDDLRGSFGAFTSVGTNQLHCISTSLPLDKLSILKTARQVLPREELTIRQLMQRDIDDERVRNDILPYLKPGEAGLDAKLFPPLLVAVVHSENGGLSDLYPEPLRDWRQHRYKSEEEGAWFEDRYYGDAFVLRIPLPSEEADPLEDAISYASEFKWDREQIKLLVLDGQHRLMALKAAFGKLEDEEVVRGYRGAGFSADEIDELGIKSIPICLVFPPKLHHGADHIGDGDSVIKVFRQIFVDVNRSAKRVSESRNILLNERNLIAEFTRSVMDDFLNEGDLPNNNTCSDDDIPLYCFEWDSPEKKEFQISDKRAISSVGVLNDCIDKLLLRSEDDYDHFREELDIMEGIQGIDPDESDKDGVSPSRVTPLRFDNWQREYIKNEFDKNWKEAVKLVIHKFYPAKNLVEYLEKKRVEIEQEKEDEQDKLSIHSLEYLLGSRSDRDQIRRISEVDEDWVGKFQPSACSQAVQRIDDFLDDIQARVKNGPFSRLFFSNLGQTQISNFIYRTFKRNLEEEPEDIEDLGHKFVSDFNNAFEDSPAKVEFFKSEKEWNTYTISSLGKQSWKKDHITGLLLTCPCFFEENPNVAEFFEDKEEWEDQVLEFYKLGVSGNDSYIRHSLESRLPYQVKTDDDIRQITDEEKRSKMLKEKVSERAQEIIDEIGNFVLSNGSPPDPVVDEVSGG